MSRRAADLAQQAAHRERAALFETGAALWEAFFGNPIAARRSAMAALDLAKDREVEYGAAFALAVSGDHAGSQALAEDLEKRLPEDTCVRFTYLPVLRAIIALKGGHSSEAVELLKGAEPYDIAFTCSWFGSFGSLYSPYVRGELLVPPRRTALFPPFDRLAELGLGRRFQAGSM